MFAKVMFLHLSVSHSVHTGGGCLPQCMLGYTPPQSRHLPGADTPYAVHAGRYGQQAGGTHPGMHTCFQFIYIVSYTKMLTKPTFCISKKNKGWLVSRVTSCLNITAFCMFTKQNQEWCAINTTISSFRLGWPYYQSGSNR